MDMVPAVANYRREGMQALDELTRSMTNIQTSITELNRQTTKGGKSFEFCGKNMQPRPTHD